MTEVIQDWLGTRLGVLLDLCPQKFGRNTKDGKLLANLLYSYGVIPYHVMKQIKDRSNYYECYNNIMILKPWLEFIGVCHDESELRRMAGGEGSAAISVFYAVYLNLERKDRLHYISAQKERKFSEESCKRKFKIEWVPERKLMGDSVEITSDLELPLVEKQDLIEWHRANCKAVLETIRKTKEKFEKSISRKQPKLGPVISRHTTSQPLNNKLLEEEETRQRICAFEQKHPQESPDMNYSQLIELKKRALQQYCIGGIDLTKANIVMDNIKQRRQSEIYARNFQKKMQQTVLDEEWKQITENQDKEFENAVSASLLKQSQYEKQMASKLFTMRNQKKVLAENRRMIEDLKMDQKMKEYYDVIKDSLEERGEYSEREEFEKERMAELHRRLYDEKAKRRKELIQEESRKIWDAFVDIAIRISEIRELTGCYIPKCLMKDIKELFFNDLSIFDILDNLEELHQSNNELTLGSGDERGEEERDIKDEEYERKKQEEAERQGVLSECDLNDYLNLMGPWMVELLFPDGSETEVKHVVLGYIVHKLLGIKYPAPNIPAPVAIKPMKPTSVIQGPIDENACKMLIDLMDACKVLTVRVDDAINFVLLAYKEELSVVRDIDISFQKMTADALKDKTFSGKEKELKKKTHLLKKEPSQKLLDVEDFSGFLDKETQTPRMIPEDDPLLSPNAEIGKIAFEALGAGDPVPDPAIASAVVAYVVSKQDDYNGWILLNYPLLYSQASYLECALTGYRILPDRENMEYLEETEGFSYRDVCVNPFAQDSFAESRTSRLVPRPDIFAPQLETPRTYFGSFIKMKKVTDSSRGSQAWELKDNSPIEEFYSEQEVFFNFEYSNLGFQTVKDLGKMVLMEVSEGDRTNPDLVPKTSLEIFGEIVLELNEKWDVNKKTNKKTDEKGTAGDAKKMGEVAVGSQTENSNTFEESSKVENSPPPQPAAAKPGDPAWEWASGPQSEVIQLALASLWENMEVVYTEDLKGVFFALRVHQNNVLSYIAFKKQSVLNLMSMPDERQKVLGDFQHAFNEIDEDLRPDVDVKCELHVRVSELEEALMGMADERKMNAQRDLTKLAQDSWVADEMANLANLYLTAVQLEADRCIDSCQVIMDYYVSLQERTPEEKSLGKIVVSKIHMRDRKYSIISPSLSKTSSNSVNISKNSDTKRSNKSFLPEQGTRSLHERPSKTRSWADRRKRSSDSSSFLNGASEVISQIVANLALPEDGLTPFHNFFIDNVQTVTNEISSVVTSCISETKKTDKGVSKNPKKPSAPTLGNSGNLSLEWSTALEHELSRFTFRTKLILARGIFHMNEFLTTILNVISSLAEDITEFYLKEIRSISDCCKVFRCAIEEEMAIQLQLELREAEFIVNDKVLLFHPSGESVTEWPEEDEKKHSFNVHQISMLCQKLQKVAPNGEIIKRSLLYILEDLRVSKPEFESCLPTVWRIIEPNELITILNEIYQDLEIVHWKDLIIYILDVPMPTDYEILTMRNSYKKFDCLMTELITRENYDAVNFWFDSVLGHYSEVERKEKVKDLLFRLYQVDEIHTNYSAMLLAFCKDENPENGFKKALSLAVGKQVISVEVEKEEILSMQGEGERSSLYEPFEEYNPTSTRKVCSETEMKCIPKERMVRCLCADFQKSITTSTTDEEYSYSEGGAEEGSIFYFETTQTEEGAITSIVPFKILSSILKASFPSLHQLSVLLDCKQTFYETLNSIYDDLECTDGNVEVSKLLEHKFINRLIHCTNKFKFIKVKHLFGTSLSLNGPEYSRDKLNVNFYSH